MSNYKLLNEKARTPKITKYVKYHDEPENVEEKKVAKVETKYILFFTKFFKSFDWTTGDKLEAGEEVLKSINCPVTNCFFTHNHTLLSNETLFNAIVFHVPEPISKLISKMKRNKNQLFIMASLESPEVTRTNLNDFKNLFNLTMTYRMDSDIRWDYGKFVDLKTNEIVAPSQSPVWRMPDQDFYDENLMEIFRNKSIPIAWFVSHCNARSRRDTLAKAVNTKLKVDIYGRCGNFTCPVDDQKCYDLLQEKYFFYFSFENALCKDYITEKLFRPMDRYVIPIVFNGGNTSLYAPPKSFIDANEFKDVNELVRYLRYLIDNPEKYIKFFWWKKYYEIRQHPTYKYMLCDVCKKLNDPIYMSMNHIHDDVKSWWKNDQCHSQNPNIKF